MTIISSKAALLNKKLRRKIDFKLWQLSGADIIDLT